MNDIRLAVDVTPPSDVMDQPTQIRMAVHNIETLTHMADKARERIKSACAHYKPDDHDGLRILCNSGAGHVYPRQGRKCLGCPVGQLVRKDGDFVFLGEQPTPEDDLVDLIFHNI